MGNRRDVHRLEPLDFHIAVRVGAPANRNRDLAAQVAGGGFNPMTEDPICLAAGAVIGVADVIYATQAYRSVKWSLARKAQPSVTQ